MTPERWKRIEALYQEALERSPGDRSAFLAEACGRRRGDAARRRIASRRVRVRRWLPCRTSARMSRAADFVPATMTGTSLGGYHLQALIGAGGMGEVYRAHDAKLGRDVAIKILPSAFTSHPDRLARFEREARMLAALNHPNICAIYGFEEADGVRFLILELVEGDTLARQARASVECAREGRGPAARVALGHRAANRRRARSRPRQGHHPPRPEAREHQDHAGRSRQGARLRPRQGCRRRRFVAGSDERTDAMTARRDQAPSSARPPT